MPSLLPLPQLVQKQLIYSDAVTFLEEDHHQSAQVAQSNAVKIEHNTPQTSLFNTQAAHSIDNSQRHWFCMYVPTL